MDFEFHTKRTDLANDFAAAGAALLDYMGTDAALAAIPNTTPQQYVVAGTLAMIGKVLPADATQAQAAAPATLTEQQVADFLSESGTLTEFGHRTLINGEPMQARLGFLTNFANAIRLAHPAAPVEPVAIPAGWSIDTPEFRKLLDLLYGLEDSTVESGRFADLVAHIDAWASRRDIGLDNVKEWANAVVERFEVVSPGEYQIACAVLDAAAPSPVAAHAAPSELPTMVDRDSALRAEPAGRPRFKEPGYSDSLADRVFNLVCNWKGDPSLHSAILMGHTMACEQAYDLVMEHEQSEAARCRAEGGGTKQNSSSNSSTNCAAPSELPASPSILPDAPALMLDEKIDALMREAFPKTKPTPAYRLFARAVEREILGTHYVAAKSAPSELPGDLVTRDSALQAIECVEQHNGPGRAAQARAMLTSAPSELPAILFDGKAVLDEVAAHGPNPPRTSADNVAEVLDAVVRLMRKERGECNTCDGNGVVGFPPDQYEHCPECAAPSEQMAAPEQADPTYRDTLAECAALLDNMDEDDDLHDVPMFLRMRLRELDSPTEAQGAASATIKENLQVGAARDADLRAVVAFLMGEAPLEGVNFGERHPTKAGIHWWRLNLRAAMHPAKD